jgi:hypothetical protein
MKLRISANTALERRYLEVDEMGVLFREGSAMSGVTRMGFEDIDAVMRDHAHLSIQVGRAIYKIPYSAANREHTQVLTMLIEGCRRTLGETTHGNDSNPGV